MATYQQSISLPQFSHFVKKILTLQQNYTKIRSTLLGKKGIIGESVWFCSREKSRFSKGFKTTQTIKTLKITIEAIIA
ncbi:MAG: hypothetical protein GPI96_05595 [Microcystis aeruginosa BS13-02]|jgi:hypothetical protein|nr:hypothetical protein [Microcystis aeruginosa BS13-02]